jgi:hypothetical protein
MKIQKDHYEILLQAAKQVKESYPDFTLQNYIDNKLGKDHAKRFRWDLSYAMKKFLPEPHFICDVLYEYMNDKHLDTALKNLVKEVF